MAKDRKKRKEIKRKLLNKYRLVILNEDTFEEKISFKLSRLNVFVLGWISTFVLIALTTVLIAFTPLREYIPGYSSTKLKKQATELTYKTDSLVNVLNYTNKYLSNIRMVLSGDVANNKMNRDSLFEQVKIDPNTVDLSPIKEDLNLRAQVALEDKYNLFGNTKTESSLVLFSPVSGTISQDYDKDKKHFAVDVVAPKDSPIKSVAQGTVIFADWTTETGYVIIVEHKDNLLSVYKHNSALHKAQGEIVKAGEVIATIGNTGEITTGPHLHFELWSNGTSVNPTNYIDFK
ncbi:MULTISPECIES: M23 family metallopeptidase [Cellulophaga]|uniref:Peptidase M23 n=2 Tax=Cellulophaga TaxID=104264 RepID=F0RHD2_CELLC|nr:MULTISPECIES: M23 family metallopeptidase [Cellulophaga]ADY29172.1 Peptidase M23 [Cellulophaga lytica DSM 7489]AIM60209.1 peptidase M23 [Cellulophaga lytica]APU10078.1 peptidase M23 [Cellulophaga lytica]EWH14557.1 peptidase M23 [Cellulophaga geojensis KL-A]MDO6851972.1 M23 family metallopeptidase [Cellulophaga lytica]